MKRIAIDMDEVIADVIPKFIKLYNRDFGTPLDLKIEAGNEIFMQIPQDVDRKWLEYINEVGFFRDLEVIPDSQRVIKALQEKYDVYIVSAAMEFRNSLVDKYDWLAEHFPFIDWQHIMFCGNKIVEADVLIDDRIKNFVNFKGRPLLYTSPHNLLITEYERVNTWEEVANLLL
ncbi:5' nucleotidase, NT5C type [Pedobacter rhodius]|uniref:5'(3')-deoxyribonucleotidase n=1 Tax=Pedobacter rhodius TaxID=3004098 RepID=A0ABT4KYQ4_9SPHI|nr:5'(3')-deoxyribonucleotidase [Pedobacter sp. SJ11]MCZ4224061.1 5'(3')-deoxyribonucleotidase [Pedobacter sp. SJ11]